MTDAELVELPTSPNEAVMPMDEASTAQRLTTGAEKRKRLARAALLYDQPRVSPSATNHGEVAPAPVVADDSPSGTPSAPPTAAPDLGDPVKVRAPADDEVQVTDDFIARFGNPRKPDKPAEAPETETPAATLAPEAAPVAESAPGPDAVAPEDAGPEEVDHALPTAVPWTSPMEGPGSRIVVLPLGQHSYYIPPDTGTLPRLSDEELTVWSVAQEMLSPKELVAQAGKWVDDPEPIYHRLVERGHLREIDLSDEGVVHAANSVAVQVNWKPEANVAENMYDDPVGGGLPRDLHYLILSCLRDRSFAKAVDVMKLYHGSPEERMRTAFIRLWPLVPNSLISFMPYPRLPQRGTFGNPLHTDEWRSLDKPWDIPGSWAPLDMDGEQA